MLIGKHKVGESIIKNTWEIELTDNSNLRFPHFIILKSGPAVFPYRENE
jgi:hypothetical protein